MFVFIFVVETISAVDRSVIFNDLYENEMIKTFLNQFKKEFKYVTIISYLYQTTQKHTDSLSYDKLLLLFLDDIQNSTFS